VNKKVDLEEGAENSIIPPINYHESDIMKAIITTFKNQMDVSNMHLVVNYSITVYTIIILF